MRQRCVMSLWLFNIFMDGFMREMKARVGKVSARLKLNGETWEVVTSLFADDTVLLAEDERQLQRVFDEFHKVCLRGNLKVIVGKS